MELGFVFVLPYHAGACSEDRALLRSNPSVAAGSKTDGAGPSGPTLSFPNVFPSDHGQPASINEPSGVRVLYEGV